MSDLSKGPSLNVAARYRRRFAGCCGTSLTTAMALLVLCLVPSLGSAQAATPGSMAHDSSTQVCDTTSDACITSYSTGIVFSYMNGLAGYVNLQFIASTNYNGAPSWTDQTIECYGPNYSVFVPLAAGTWIAQSTSGVGKAVPLFNGVFVVGGTNTTPPPATWCIPPSKAVGLASTPDGGGYWIAYSNGAVSPHGDAGNYGGVSNLTLNAPINHIVATPDGRGYWLVAADGGTFSEGDAQFYGSTGSMHLNAPIVDMAPTPDGGGYWLVGADGGIFSYGDAVFHGSTGSLHLNQPVVGMAPDYGTGGYWLVARDGGIFAFDAPFYGSTGSIHLNKPVNGMAATQDGLGYWFVASDGGIFDYGDAPFHGSSGSLVLNAPIVGMAPDFATGGYWLLGSDGGIFSYDAPFLGGG